MLPHEEPGGRILARENSLSIASDSSYELTANQILAIRVTTCLLAGISFVAAVPTLYWFLNMKKVFRHR